MKAAHGAAIAQSPLAGPEAQNVLMGAADHVRAMLQAHPGLLTPQGALAEDGGAAPMYHVAQRVLDDIRSAARMREGGTALPAACAGLPEVPAPPRPAASETRPKLKRALEAAFEAAVQGGASVDTPPSPAPEVNPEATQESVMAKLQAMQRRLVEARWAPGQPFPPDIGNPLDIFRGETHLLPPDLLKALQGMVGSSTGPTASQSAAGQTATGAPDVIEPDDSEDDGWE